MSTAIRVKCDGSPLYGTGCHAAARWLVQVGERKTDGQLACSRHLGPACEAMLGAEGRRNVTLTVRELREPVE